MGFDFIKSGYQKIKSALGKTGSLLGNKIRSLFSGSSLDEEALEKLEQIFYEADMGVQTAQELTSFVREKLRANPKMTADELIAAIKVEMTQVLSKESSEMTQVAEGESPLVILVVGVNGNGKTTSIAKLASRFQKDGKKVILAAADTFRAAAIDQLTIWSTRLNADIVKGHPKSDPAAVAFDAVTAAKSRKSDVVIIDTAGRLHTKIPLMQELDKIRRACKKVHPTSPHETLLVLDATIGQNAVEQAKIFNQYTPITGLILSKMDSRAKGGIIISIQRQLGIPVKFIGVGEDIEDLQPFNAKEFAEAIFE